MIKLYPMELLFMELTLNITIKILLVVKIYTILKELMLKIKVLKINFNCLMIYLITSKTMNTHRLLEIHKVLVQI